MTPEERQEIKRDHVDNRADMSGDPDRSEEPSCVIDAERMPCPTVRLLADYDHLVEVARGRERAEERLADATTQYNESPMPSVARITLRIDRLENERAEAVLALRALIDPATPEPVEGEPHA